VMLLCATGACLCLYEEKQCQKFALGAARTAVAVLQHDAYDSLCGLCLNM
jgi:hypothetical protein